MDPVAKFGEEVKANISALGVDSLLKAITLSWMERSNLHKYTYNFSWLGRPIIQTPNDIMMAAMPSQIRPRVVVNIGTM